MNNKKKKRELDARDILRKYERKLDEQLGGFNQDTSRDYSTFKKEMVPQIGRYEKWAKAIGGVINIKLAKKDDDKIRKQIETANLDLVPGNVVGFSLVSTIIVFFAGLLLSLGIYFIIGSFPFLFLLLAFMACMFLFYYLYTIPSRLAKKHRLKAGSQMIPAILYVVVYMKHTSNLEKAIHFASQHLQEPLSTDFKKVFYNVEIGKFSNIKESLDNYLEDWRDDAIEFVESFHLIESSLFEPSEPRRVEILERALQVVLDGVYDKMLRYSREIRSPLTNIYMLGIVLPTLMLALLPLASTLLKGLIKWHHIVVLFNIIIPFFVFYLTNSIMQKRPGGHGESELLELNPLYPNFKDKRHYLKAALICLPIFLIGISPFIFLAFNFDASFSDIGLGFFQGDLIGFNKTTEGIKGPFGLLSLFLSLLVPISIALFFSLSFKGRTKKIINYREDTKKLESEFTNSLFQLGNRLGDGNPAEIAFSKVAQTVKGQQTQNFFRIVNLNIQQKGMSLENAIFHPKRGAAIYYPSSLVSTSMRILVEAIRKGLKVAARALMSISDYIKNIRKIEERLKDLLAEVVSDMRGNMTFLAPLLAGIVVGLAGMITTILSKLINIMEFSGDASVAGLGNISTLLDLFNMNLMIPPYFLQIAIGIYLIEIVFILTSALVVVDAGEDKLKKISEIGKNLKISILIYTAVAFLSILILSLLSNFALSGIS